MAIVIKGESTKYIEIEICHFKLRFQYTKKLQSWDEIHDFSLSSQKRSTDGAPCLTDIR